MAKPLVSHELWARIEPELPVVKRRSRYPGRKRLPDRRVLTGIILFVLKTGIPWEDLPQEMGCGSGMTCWRRLKEWNDAGVCNRLQHISVLVLTMFEDDDSVFAAMRAGARGNLLEDSREDEILRAIRVVASGEAIFGAAIAARLIDYFASASQESTGIPGPDRSRARSSRANRSRPKQRGDRRRTRPEPQDRPQSCLEHLYQASGDRPSRCDHQSTRVRPRSLNSKSALPLAARRRV